MWRSVAPPSDKNEMHAEKNERVTEIRRRWKIREHWNVIYEIPDFFALPKVLFLIINSWWLAILNMFFPQMTVDSLYQGDTSTKQANIIYSQFNYTLYLRHFRSRKYLWKRWRLVGRLLLILSRITSSDLLRPYLAKRILGTWTSSAFVLVSI